MSNLHTVVHQNKIEQSSCEAILQNCILTNLKIASVTGKTEQIVVAFIGK